MDCTPRRADAKTEDRTIEAALRLSRDAPEASTLLILLSMDVDNASIALRLFETFKAAAHTDTAAIREMMCHASCFVCAARRVGRLVETISRTRSCLMPKVADVVKQEWSKKKAFFEEFIEPRNAIEHIDGEAKNRTSPRTFSLMNDRFEVANGKSVTINREALTKITEPLDRIVEAILRDYHDPAARPSPGTRRGSG